MSFCTSALVPEGIVVAGDSRQTSIVGGINRVATDSGVKVFQLSNTVLAATAGWAFLKPADSNLWRSISSHIEDFKPAIQPNSTVQSIAEQLWNYFTARYNDHTTQNKNTAVQQDQSAFSFVVAGYDPGTRAGKIFHVSIPTQAAPHKPVRTLNDPGAWWIGQTDVVSRIILGRDSRIESLPLVQAAKEAGTLFQQLNPLNYVIHWQNMTLQDAIDFSVAMIQITTTIQKFTAGIQMQPGQFAGVGGPIDVAVVQPGSTVQWIQQKKPHA